MHKYTYEVCTCVVYTHTYVFCLIFYHFFLLLGMTKEIRYNTIIKINGFFSEKSFCTRNDAILNRVITCMNQIIHVLVRFEN